ncbi:hypothetical protein LXL04_022236 [Taraxacum kok-saghyz]
MDFSSALILGIVFHYLLTQRKENDPEQKNSSLSSSSNQQQSLQEEDGQTKDSFSSSSPDKPCSRFSLAEIKLATNDFDDALVIGKGGFGNVYKGTIDFGEGTDVAIKRLKLDSDQGASEFRAEIEMLSNFRHSHIVSLLGYHEGADKREMILVYEYMSNGSLDDHLHKRRDKGTNSSMLTWIQRLRICIGAARGLDYLHTGTGVQSRIVHRDIKSSNILLDENFAAKISDFGLSRIVGTFGYMDAEYFATHRLTRKSDVYAFGVVLLEVLCGRPALDFTLDEEQHSLSVWAKQCIREGKVDQIIDPCLRGKTKAKFLKEFGRIAYECLLDRSKDRPTMTKVVSRLELVLAWTLQSDQKHIGRSTFIEKPWSLFLIKPPKGGISSPTKQLEQSINNERKYIVMKNHATKIVQGGYHSGGVATNSREVVVPILKVFTFSELRSMTRNFTPKKLIGEGGFGKVYKGWLDSVTFVPRKDGDGLAVAIKRLNPDGMQGLKEWQAEVNLFGAFSHPNIVKLFGYCREKDNELLIVYEYMKKGSLENYLFRKHGLPLPWETRIKIAMGAAQALAFLHAAENNKFNAKLSDFGLARLGPVTPVYGESHVSTRAMGTYGYAAPEYVATGHLYVKSDVYGFGVVMLEMITGLRVLDTSRSPQQQNLVDWAKPSLTILRKLRKIIDPRLEQVYPSKGAMKAAKLIQNCLDNDPKHRPSMEEVVASLEEINSIKKKIREVESITHET